jgi:hypothetical protein
MGWVLFFVFLAAGCIREGWLARLYMVRAENDYDKGHELRVKREVSYDQRLKFYKKSCDSFVKAYEYDQRVFTLNRIMLAIDACTRVGNIEAQQLFEEMEMEYSRTHPKEVEHGDAVPFLGME